MTLFEGNFNENKQFWHATHIWDKVFKRGLGRFCGRQSLKNLKRYGLLPSNFLKAVFHKIYLVHS